jgi:hypothetical protein
MPSTRNQFAPLRSLVEDEATPLLDVLDAHTLAPDDVLHVHSPVRSVHGGEWREEKESVCFIKKRDLFF